MKKRLELKEFISNSTDDILKEYTEKLYENLKIANQEAEKFWIRFVFIFLVYILIKVSKNQQIDLGIITVQDISLIIKILPLITVYVLINTITIEDTRKELVFSINAILEKRYNLRKNFNIKKTYPTNYVAQLFIPFSKSLSIIHLNEPKGFLKFISLIVFIGAFFISLMPYFLFLYMLYDCYINYTNDSLGILSFSIAILGAIILLIYLILRKKD